MAEKAKKLSFLTVISTVICVVFVCEAAAPAAAIGNQQFFWWIFLILTFLLPYGMIVAELGTTYDGEGGIYDWVRDGLGDKWGARISWYYWVNYPLWIASLATMFPDILGMVFNVTFDLPVAIAIELAFVWIVYLMGRSKAADSEWVLNGGAIIKVAVAVIVGALGIWYAMENGFASDMSPATFLPELTNTNALGYLSIIIFNFMGFEVICTMTDDMANPERDIPKAIIMGGIAIAVIYLFAGFGIGAAIPAADIDPDYGMIYAVQTMVGDSAIFKIICIAFLITLFANMAAWSFGVNSVARYAAEHGNMPKVFASMISKDDMPNGANLVNAVVASLVLALQLVPIDAISNGIFWMLFGTSVVFLLLTYIPMFPAFLNLRKNDPNRERVFTFPFKGALMKVAIAVPCIELVLTIVATVVPLSEAEIADKVPMLIIFIVILLLGEVVRVWSARDRKEEYKGLTPELAAKRLAEEAEEK
ncbi:APC family permease [Candidatus Collinsella stercoripullorum]|uniref:APC family permease n=1 Tax=Candidatus Collinsella stercoripullorum TaxID=2838522 RepID=UPI0022E93677|nr:APC family permease [Candidatus Collinsella stercoripullorum]